jgi:competence protein ComGC
MRINSIRRDDNNGFAVVEALLILIIIAAVVGVGAYVVRQKNQATKTVSSGAPTSAVTTTGSTSQPSQGTSASIDQLTQMDAKSEASVNTAADSQIQSYVNDTNSAASSVGGSYNENNL